MYSLKFNTINNLLHSVCQCYVCDSLKGVKHFHLSLNVRNGSFILSYIVHFSCSVSVVLITKEERRKQCVGTKSASLGFSTHIVMISRFLVQKLPTGNQLVLIIELFFFNFICTYNHFCTHSSSVIHPH